MSVKQVYPHTAADDFVETTDPRGEVSAHMYVDVTDILGNTRSRRVSLGRCSASLWSAKGMIAKVREVQPEKHISARFTIHL